MEEKKFDPYQFTGVFLIALILTWMLFNNDNTQEIPESNQDKDKTSKVSDFKNSPLNIIGESVLDDDNDRLYGVFGRFMQNKKSEVQILENENLYIEIDPKGGVLKRVWLKDFKNYLDEPLNLIYENNNFFNVIFSTLDGRTLNSKDFFFTSELTAYNDKQILSLKSKISDQEFFEFIYSIDPKTYLINFDIRSSGMSSLLNSKVNPVVEIKNRVFRNSKSINYENMYTELTYGYEDDKVDYLSATGEDEETENEVRWVSFRQHFFSSIIIPKEKISEVSFSSVNLADRDDLDQVYTKDFSISFPIKYSSGNFDSGFEFYFGPSDHQILKSYDRDLESSVSLGWGIFGWINKFVFLPLFGFLSSFLPYGISIIVMTIIARLAMSPVTYKSYVSQVKMKILRPEIEQINKKFKDDAIKRQQETMSLYSQAGANPMSGCIPALIQLPVFYSLFVFFPIAFELRQKSFLWADDLSSYDVIVELPFYFPLYGDHISLFPILASIAIFIYTKMTMGQQTMPQQPGMPNMKIIMYLMPLMMLFFFNNYSSGLSLYYFISNLLTIFLMLIIKNYIIDNDKIHAQIEENKKRPKKTSGFAARLQKAMEEAEKQKKTRNRRF
ncbi:MAG: membrane protein insertase YidC [Flavobacteriaceae bacterium]|nr:membrane protein insertase YidC [Flavobacteriaceae bacterium]